MGDSAGGNLATMLGVLSRNPEFIRDIDPTGTPRTALACYSVVSLYGVLDRLSWIDNQFPLSKVMLESYAGKAAFEREVDPSASFRPQRHDRRAVVIAAQLHFGEHDRCVSKRQRLRCVPVWRGEIGIAHGLVMLKGEQLPFRGGRRLSLDPGRLFERVAQRRPNHFDKPSCHPEPNLTVVTARDTEQEPVFGRDVFDLNLTDLRHAISI